MTAPTMPVRELAFSTSGSTGEPVSWLRTTAQVDAEAGLLAALCAPGRVDGVVCYAPPTHLYGYLMGLAVPRLLGVPCWYLSLTENPARVFAGLRCPLVAAVPAALSALSRSASALRSLDEMVLVHGSAVLPPDVDGLLSATDGRARLVELFGATETGLIASRARADQSWTPAPDVELVGMQPGVAMPLRVRSPRLARRPDRPTPAAAGLDDVVVVQDDGRFVWRGRRTRLVKVNGRRVDLDQVETMLRAAVPAATVTCRADRDPLRGEWFTVLVHPSEPSALAAVEQACRQLPSWQRPRAVRAP
jgi:acyl-coenzyme A synthetase/AMP-(fatty) acid ligase